ncbi:MAG: signal transduction histidine kinase/DNA-binding response OmpR family regulator [Cognaticolwellia sp.]|jgi:signal transduction histidine kinase/DNA-binding response OmpR family regulator
MMVSNRMLLFFLILLANLLIGFTVQSQSKAPSQYVDKSFVQKLSTIEAMVDQHQALELITLLSAEKTLSTLDKLSVLASQSRIYHQLGQLENAIETAQKEQQLANEFDLKRLAANAYKRVGVYAYYNGKNRLALYSYQQALNYYLTLDEPIAQANLYNNIALVYGRTAQNELELAIYKKIQPIYQKFGSKKDQLDVLNNIANLHLRLKRYDASIQMFYDIIEKRKEISDKVGLAMAYSDLGSSYKYAGDYQQAEHFMKLALSLHRQHKDDYNAASTLHNLAELNNFLYNINQAIIYAKEGINLSVEQGHNNAYVGVKYSLATAYFYQGKYDIALQNLEQSTKVINQIGNKEQLKHNLSLQALIYAAQHRPLKAVKSLRDFMQTQLELANNELNSQLAIFNSEQLKQQVEQLKQQKRLQVLEMSRSSQVRIIMIVAILLIGFLIARRLIEQRSKQALESKVKQRTIELEYLMQELQSANKIKSQFLANMSHEIRTPLTTVIGQAEAIMSGDVEEEFISKEVKIIHGNSLHLLELTNNILDLSKIEANKIELEIQTENLHDILQALANMFSLQASSKGLTFDIIHYLPEPFLIEMDGFRVKQILINLCANAVKFTPKGHVELNISQSENNLMFKITDSGIGMSSSQLQSLFESFTQGDSSISRRFGGTGLGLCLSDQLAKIMGGKIEVESELNQGSVFAFSLPCAASFSEQCSESKISSTRVTVEKEFSKLQGTILLADDHNDNRRLIARLLVSLGLEVLTARNGLEAVALFEQHQPALILMDIQMPEMDGVEAFNILRQKGCKTPIIALTANAMSHEITHYLSLGFTGHLSKPIERNILIPTIIKFYDGSLSYEKANDIFSNLDMSDLVQKFKSNLVLEQQDLVLHINNNDLEQLGKLSHRIAGAAKMFGFAELSKCSVQLETVIKNNQIYQSSNISHHTQELLNEIDQVLW